MPTAEPGWRWENLTSALEAWGFDPVLDRALATITDTPADILPGRAYETDADGTPIAAVRYVDDGEWRIVFSVALQAFENALLLMHVFRRPW